MGDVAKYASMETKKLKLADNISESEINALLKDNPKAWVQEIQLKAKLPKKLGGGFKKVKYLYLSLIHISEPTRPCGTSRMPSSA